MKKTGIVLLFAFIAFSPFHCQTLLAQAKGYECTYQEKIDVASQISQYMGDGPDKDAVLSFMNKRKSFYLLTFADGKSMFEKDMSRSDDDFGMGASSPSIFVDFDKQEQTTLINFFGRSFIITDTMQTGEWKFTDETKEIAGLTCTKATGGDSVEVTVWFSMETPIPAGPQTCYGLPGLVAEMSIGPVTYTLTEIKILDKDPKLKQPSKGKKVTQKEFEEIVKQKLDEMGLGGMGGGGFQMMRM